MKKFHLFLTFVALSLATSSLWATPPAVNGQLPCQFSVSATKKVYFSQGNLQYNSTNNETQSPRWQFASEQYEYIGNTEGNTNITSNGKANNTGVADLFGWVGSSSTWTNELMIHGLTSSTTGYGNGKTENLKSDWGTLRIWNGGDVENSGWRTLTYTEWQYLLTRSGDKASNVNGVGVSWVVAVVNGVTGLILFPDGSVFPSFDFLTALNPGTAYEATQNSCSKEQWEELERNGCVFLPAAGDRRGTTVDRAGLHGAYWTSTPRTDNSGYACNVDFGNSRSSVSTTGEYYYTYGREKARSVRLVKDATGDARVFTASVINPPTANSRTFDNSMQKIFFEGTAFGGTMMYSIDGGSTWSAYSSQNVNAGEFIVHYKIEGSGCFNDFTPDPDTIHVTIKRRTASAPTSMPTIAAVTPLTYNGSAQNLVTSTGSLSSGYTLVYSTDGENWSTTIPQGTNAGDYTVYYKFHKGSNEEYIPSLNTINASIAKADLSATLPESTISIPYDGAAHTLLEIDPVADCVIWYKLGDGDWTTTPPTGTDAGDYSVQYKIVPNDAENYNTIGPNTVTVTILDYPTVYDVNVDPTAKLMELLNTPSDLRIKRSIVANDEYNTLCLPFSLDASALAASPLAGFNRLKTLRGAKVTGTAPDLSIDIFVEDATTIEAGIPYLISYPAGDNIVDPVFHDVTVTTTTPSATSADGVTFQGMFAQVHIDPYTADREQDYLFLGANSQLMWPASSQTDSSIKMRGFRAYFIIDRSVITPALAPKGTRARIVDAPKTATGIENASATFGESQKILENGILYIIRNGVRYNAQGQIVK